MSTFDERGSREGERERGRRERHRESDTGDRDKGRKKKGRQRHRKTSQREVEIKREQAKRECTQTRPNPRGVRTTTSWTTAACEAASSATAQTGKGSHGSGHLLHEQGHPGLAVLLAPTVVVGELQTGLTMMV
jgi:hypothetical protein